MKTLWNAVSFLAVVHLLALLMFGGWLWQSQRLNVDRLKETRTLFAMSIPEAESAAKKARAQAQTDAERQKQEYLKAHPATDSATQIQHVSLVKQQEEQSLRRIHDEKNMLLAQLESSNDQLEQKKADLDQQRIEWENAIRSERLRKVDEQFLQAVKQYEQAPPKQGKRMIVELVNGQHIDQAVAYLDALNPRSASKILKEFKTDSEIALATQLLEKLRTFGAQNTAQANAASSAISQSQATKEASDANSAAAAHE